MKKTNAIALKEEQSVQFNAETLIAQAIDRQVPVETMEKLLAMRRELKAEKAKEEFDMALARFQKECPTIQKTKKVYEKNSTAVRYQYAPLDAIIEQTKDLLAKHGFSYSMNTIQDDKMLGVICKATHKMGHSEETKFSVPIGIESYMSDVQKYGARLTFAKRYAFCNAFGILTGDEDNDGDTGEKTAKKTTGPVGSQKDQTKNTASVKQVDFIKKLLKEKGYTEKGLMTKYEVTDLSQLTSDQASTAIEGLMKLKPIVKKTSQIEEVEASGTGEAERVPEEEIDLDEVDKGISEMQWNDKDDQDPAIIGPH